MDFKAGRRLQGGVKPGAAMSRLLFDSRPGVDKIVFLHEGQLSLPSGKRGANTTVLLPHSLPVLLLGQYSFTRSFESSYVLGTLIQRETFDPTWERYRTNSFTAGAIWEKPPGQTNGQVNIYATDSEQLNGGEMFYRVYGLAADLTRKYPHSKDQSGKFILNTDYNYLKLIKAGYLSGEQRQTIYHGLGRVPFCRYWTHDPRGNQINFKPWGVSIAGDLSSEFMTADEQNIYYTPSSQAPVKPNVYYRIYDI